MWTRDFIIGDRVYWKDPDEDISSGYYKIIDILYNESLDEEIFIIKNEAGSIAEVWKNELFFDSELR
jgi:hypothetical protein